MDNIFDYVADFYAQDEEWNTVLQQSYVENFLRTKLWQGASEEELLKDWDHIMVLCIFLGNSDNYLGDMTKEDFIDCVGWCARNVSDFMISVENVSSFLDSISQLYAHLKKKRIISSCTAPAEAKAKLIVNGQVQMLQEDGHFYPRFERYNVYSTPDLPAKVFLNIGERLDNLLLALRKFFEDKKYKKDIERATFLYAGILMTGVVQEKPGSEEYAQCFWDYFLFDYRMIANDKCPLQHFYDSIAEIGFSKNGQVSRDVLLELLQAQLVFFTVQNRTEDGIYSCMNVFTGEDYMLMLPFDQDVDTENMIFMGHIFYNKTMVMNCLRGMQIPKTSLKRFMKVMKQAKDWMGIREGADFTWDAFVQRYPMFVRHMSLIYSAYVKMDGFNAETCHQNYRPAPVLEDAVSEEIWYAMRPYAFSAFDIKLAQQLWSDYVAATEKNVAAIRRPEIWAAGVINCFVQANGVYNYNAEHISLMCNGVPISTIKRTTDEIKNQILLEPHDPRYLNEEGLLLMLLM
ncbi:MAG: hypothetical protein SOV56_04965 [Phascolarctobacterium sp.]|nr:hypothetical protein [Phascolarctobacterium sp.]